MGLNYSFRIITPRAALDRLRRAVVGHLGGDAGERLPPGWPGRSAGLTFAFPSDGALLRYSQAGPTGSDGGSVRVGAVYTSIAADVQYGGRETEFTPCGT